MNTTRAKQIYESDQTFSVMLDGDSVWIEHVDEANDMATVQVSSIPVTTKTVSCDRLQEA